MTAEHRANRLLAAMRPEDFVRLEPHLDLVDLPRGMVLYEGGESIRQIYFPHDTVVSVVAVMADGGTAEMTGFGREGVFGLVSASIFGESLGRYIVQVPGTASRIIIERVQEALNASPALLPLNSEHTRPRGPRHPAPHTRVPGRDAGRSSLYGQHHHADA